ncbi:MAG: serine hydrolase [Alphaproteobacteria bacterium]|nr:serine hydrolase [Alphaproteobacteria bacterium]
MLRFATMILFAAAILTSARAEDLQSFVDTALKDARDKHHLPAIAALLQIDGKVAADVAIGLRAEGHPQAVTTDDLWHLGSDTKAITATMIARLVERGVMSFDDTLAKCFPEIKDMNAVYRAVTVKQLLSHMAGMPPMTDEKELPEYFSVIKDIADERAQRAALVKHYLALPPARKPGTDYEYSNLGFIVAGAAAEARTGKSWEDLVHSEVFQPLGLTHAGFGAPPSTAAIEEPWGHDEKNGKLVAIDPASPGADNPPSLGPAGTIHMSLHDWMLFAQDQSDGEHGHGKLLKPETYRELHTPIASNGLYALGWGAKAGPDGVPLLLTHSGSNGYWLAYVRIWLKDDIVLLLVANAGNRETATAFKEVRDALDKKLNQVD